MPRSLTRATTESRKSRPLVDGGSVRRYSAHIYARPGSQFIREMWYERHRDRKLRKNVFGERGSAGVVACEVELGDRVGSEAKGKDCGRRVKLSNVDFAITMLHTQRSQTMLLKMA